MVIHTIDLKFLARDESIASFVIPHKRGIALVESGPYSTLPKLLEGLKKLGYSQADVTHVFLTHIHLDHAGAAWYFANHGAQILVHPLGYKHMHQPEKLWASASMIYGDKMEYLWGEMNPIDEARLMAVNHAAEVAIEEEVKLTAWHTPGHAKHHIAWQLEDIVFTGDVAGVCIEDGPVVPPCPPPDIDREAWHQSIDLLLTLPDVSALYLTHFGVIEDVRAHLTLLRDNLDSYIDFGRSYAESGKSTAEMLPDFLAFVNDFMHQYTDDEELITTYEKANPSDMSATGIMRYWKKQLKQ